MIKNKAFDQVGPVASVETGEGLKPLMKVSYQSLNSKLSNRYIRAHKALPSFYYLHLAKAGYGPDKVSRHKIVKYIPTCR